MKPVYNQSGTQIDPAQLLALLQTNNFLIGDFYRFTLNDGAQDFFSALDVPIVYGGNTYKANSLRVEGLKLKIAIGLQVDEQQIVIAARPGETLAGADFLTNVGAGLLDGAYLARFRAFWQRATGIPSLDYVQAPIGVVELCNMLVSEIGKIGRTHVEMTVKSPTKLLDLDMPRNYYSPGCVHTLYDIGCSNIAGGPASPPVTKANFAVNGQVGSGPSQLVIPWAGGVSDPVGGDSIENYAQGRLLFTSGPLANSQFLIGNNDNTALYLVYPLQQLPDVGDDFTAYPGCSKTMNTCSAKFNNLINFRGFPFVPQVYISV